MNHKKKRCDYLSIRAARRYTSRQKRCMPPQLRFSDQEAQVRQMRPAQTKTGIVKLKMSSNGPKPDEYD